MTDNITWLDFNDAPDQTPENEIIDTEEARTALLERLPEVLKHLFPAGKRLGNTFVVGDLQGHPGKSLTVNLEGSRHGLWYDFATSEGGDVFSLWAGARGMDTASCFPEVLCDIGAWLNLQPAKARTISAPKKNVCQLDTLGPPSCKWNYTDSDGGLIACVYRYDTPSGKQYRPWDVKKRRNAAPSPRPLYNQTGLIASASVVLVEGEKAADALIHKGIVATTAMNGASAPVDKTDWRPLVGKNVTIWPDNDEAGKAYAQKAAKAIAEAGARTVVVMSLPDGLPIKWDAADAVAEGRDIKRFILDSPMTAIKDRAGPPVQGLCTLFKDGSSMPLDLIEPRILTPGGLLVFGGAAKVGKTDFLLNWLIQLAAGEPFLGMRPPRPLRIYYLQAEIDYHYLRERVQGIPLSEEIKDKAGPNMSITSRFKMTLNDNGMECVRMGLEEFNAAGQMDLLVIDPIRNIFDGGPSGHSENDNNSMMYFLQERVEKLRDSINPEAGIILVHHTRKLAKQQVKEDPFLAFSGAGSLRGYYSSGLLLYRPDEESNDRKLVFELRNGSAPATKTLCKSEGQWKEITPVSERLIQQDYGEKLDAERGRKRDMIIQLLSDEAIAGRVYTNNQFADAFEGEAGLGGHKTIRERLSVLSTKGHIKFFKNSKDYGLPPAARSKFGYICVEGMIFPPPASDNLKEDDARQGWLHIKPTHYRCPQTGAVLPVENPDVWVTRDGAEIGG
ncbi:MAG: AAA family ATPase [Parvularculales bacterium]